jgi:hypothetical protein
MSDEQIRIAIAEACGWRRQISESAILGIISTQWFKPDGTKAHPHEVSGNALGYTPDYPNDLNAMHEAEKNLGNGQHEKYESHIQNILIKEELKWMSGGKNKIVSSERYIWHAVARQRAEAFLRTIYKWKESAE